MFCEKDFDFVKQSKIVQFMLAEDSTTRLLVKFLTNVISDIAPMFTFFLSYFNLDFNADKSTLQGQGFHKSPASIQ